jgi:hypothetical protein
MNTDLSKDEQPGEFEQAAVDDKSPGLVREFLEFLGENKKWWLLPIVAVLLLIGLFVFLSSLSPAAAPFIYTLF